MCVRGEGERGVRIYLWALYLMVILFHDPDSIMLLISLEIQQHTSTVAERRRIILGAQ